MLVAGDGLITTRQEEARAVWAQTPQLRPPAHFRPNWHQAHASIVRWRGLRASVIASGHGVPPAAEAVEPAWDRLRHDFAGTGLPRPGPDAAATWP